MDAQAAHLKMEIGVGAGLVTTPFWALVLNDISLIASTIAAVCGAIIGLHAVWRLWRRSHRPSPAEH